MKYTLLITFIFIALRSNSQTCNTLDKVMEISGGSPFNLRVEGGIQSDLFGIFAGEKATLKTTPGTKEVPVNQTINIHPFLEGTVKIWGEGEDNDIRIWGTAYYGINVYGIGIKVGYVLSDDCMVFFQPEYGEAKTQIDLGISFRF